MAEEFTMIQRHVLTGVVVSLLMAGFAVGDDGVLPVFVELDHPAPTVVARHAAQAAGEAFDAELHRAAVRLAQDELLDRLAVAGVPFTLTRRELVRDADLTEPGALRTVEDRFGELINAVRLEVRPADLESVRGLSGVRHVTIDRGKRLRLDNSVGYVRANGANSVRTLGIRGTGQLNPDGSSSGQVIAVLDSGIDHTNPMFDTRFTDVDFESRSGDARPVRLQGNPYQPGNNHPKIGYRFLIGTAPVEGDDTGHGTNTSSTAGGLMARADDILNGGQIVEGVAPGALLMDYKVCPSLVCVTAATIMALEDSVLPTDSAGFPKPVATVVNMSLGSDDGDPYSADGIAAGNLQFAGVVPVAAAGNAGPEENIIGSPSSHRRVLSVAATNDPGVAPNGLDVLQPDATVRATPGNPPNPGLLAETGTSFISFFSAESNGAMGFDAPLAQYFVDIGLGDTPEQVPSSVNGRICLAERGSTVDADETGSGLFGNKAAQCAARGGIAIVVYNNEPGELGSVLGPASIPLFTVSREAGLYLHDTVGFESGAFGAVSNAPIRINVADPSVFVPDIAGFSSRGPNNDYRVVKPDIGAPGVQVLMGASKLGALGSPTGFIAADGTSFACPHVAGIAALLRDDLANPGLSPSQVRAAMMNSATNLRLADGTPIPDDDPNVLIHEVGAGLADALGALTLTAVMGTNDANGLGGPDDTSAPDFLPSHSFGQRAWIGTGLGPGHPAQQASIAITLVDLTDGDTYDLSVVDAGALRGDITRPIDETGFVLSLSQNSLTVPAAGASTFDVTVAADGQPGGLQIAGTDVNGVEATEFLWYVVATSSEETVRMPFSLRVVGGVAAPNVPPVLADDSDATPKATAVTIDVLANDSDPDGDPLSVVAVSDPANGSADNNFDGTVTYTPDAGFVGVDGFTYSVSDGHNPPVAANVGVTVFDPNRNLPPSAGDDGAATEIATPVVIHVLANDFDPDGDPIALDSVGIPSSGSADANPDGSVTYTPDPGFQGVDGFSYSVCDDGAACAIGSVVVTVGCPPEPTGSFADDFEPDAEPGWTVDTEDNLNPGSPTWAVTVDPLTMSPVNAFFTDAGGVDLKDDRLVAPLQRPSGVSLLVFWHRYNFEATYDGGVLEVSTNGGASWADILDAGGSFLEGGYDSVIDTGFASPIAGRSAWSGFSTFIDAMNRVVVDLGALAGSETLFRFRMVQDPFTPGALSGTGWWVDDVSFSNTLENADPCLLGPNAFDDASSTAEGVPVAVDVLANDSDPNGDPISVASVGSAGNGNAADSGGGIVTYTPDPGFVGQDQFNYTVCDPGGLCAAASVRIQVCETPTGIPSLFVEVDPSGVLLRWDAVPGASAYDVVRGDVGSLRSSGGDFTVAVDQCLADGQRATTVPAVDDPAVGSGFFFVVRAVGCAEGTHGSYDSGEPGQSGSRDAEIAASGSTCP